MVLTEQDQIYILSGALALVAIVLLIFCVTLCVSVIRLKAAFGERKKEDVETKREASDNKYAYNNPSIQRDEELHQRGYHMHQGQIVPRVTSSSNGGYSTDPRKPARPSNAYSQSSRDFIPINDKISSRDASKDFKAIMNPKSSVFDDDLNYNDSQPPSSRVPINVNNGNVNRYIPPRPSQFNNNIMLGQNQQTENRQEGVTYFNNRAIDY